MLLQPSQSIFSLYLKHYAHRRKHTRAHVHTQHFQIQAYHSIAFYFSWNYGRTLDTELNRLSFSSYFDKSHLELWRKKQVLIRGPPNLSHCLKSWKKYLTKGVIQYHFLHLSAELKQPFFLAKSEWWQLSDRWDLWQKFSLILSPFLSFPLHWLHFQHE